MNKADMTLENLAAVSLSRLPRKSPMGMLPEAAVVMAVKLR